MTNILIADDFRPFLDEMCQLAAGAETAVVSVASSREAINRLQNNEFDLVITDLFMESQSAEDGLSVVRAAKEHWMTQVIVVTAFGKPEFSVESMRLGAFDYLERGTPGSDFRAMLCNKIRLALDYRAAKLAVVPS
jgi:DNA-binding NtrC family response regulator